MNASKNSFIGSSWIAPGATGVYINVAKTIFSQSAAHGCAHLLVFFKATTADSDGHFWKVVEHSEEVMMVLKICQCKLTALGEALLI